MTQVSPLDGVRVLDLSEGIAGPVGTMLLGDLGAEVVKVEPPRGDRLSNNPGYVCWNRNKTITTVDASRRDGANEIRRLLSASDVVVVDNSPIDLRERGLDAETTKRVAPSLIHVWVPPYGEKGEWSELAPDPSLLAAVSGLCDIYNATEDRPVIPVVPLLSYEHGALAATLAVAALFRRSRSGMGQAVTVSGLHAVAAMLAALYVDAPDIVRPPKAARSAIPHFRHYQCGDGEWLHLAALAQPFFLRALEALDLFEVMVLPGIEGDFLNLQRADRNGVAIEMLESRFLERPRAAWLQILSDADVPCAPIQSRQQWFDSETISANELRTTVVHGELGAVDLPAVPIEFSGTRLVVRHLPDSAHRTRAANLWREQRVGAPTSTPHPTGTADIDAPLEGVRVLDLGSFVAGTFGPSILGFLGADVIKIESPNGDPYRDFPVSFAAYNQSKRGLAIDIKASEGTQALHRLVRTADVLVENVRPGVRRGLGIDALSLQKVNSRLVHCSVTGWGERGALSETPAFDPLLQARSGLMQAQGGDSDPVYSSMLVHDVGAGTLAALGILAALYERETSGEGREVGVSLSGASTLLQSGELTTFPLRPPPEVGGEDWQGPSATRHLYRCTDGWLLAAAKNSVDLSSISGPLSMDGDADSRLTKLLEGRFISMSTAEGLKLLSSLDVPAAPVLSRTALYTDPWLEQNDFFHIVDQPGLGPCTVVSGFASWRGARIGYPAAAPTIGNHTREVLCEVGLSDRDIDGLLQQGVLRSGGE
jgi:crotonobetainyl-CoA:carnitine CoA-transferase CaiB-like acyl-CoA transferase